MKRQKMLFLAVMVSIALLTGCTTPSPVISATPVTQTQTPVETAQNTVVPSTLPADVSTLPLVRVAMLKGPTGMGMVWLMNQNEQKLTANRYEFTLVASPDEIVVLLTTGAVDVAAIPTNLAATLYQKTSGQIQLAAINTLGVLSILERGDTIQSIEDLAGKTIHATGQGSVPEYALAHILSVQGVKDVTVEYQAEHAELAALAAAGKADLVMLPEPFVTTLLAKAPDMRIALDLTKEWETAVAKEGQAGSRLAMGGLVVQKAFATEQKAALDVFLEEYAQSVAFVKADTAQASTWIEQYQILPSAAVAAKALPNSNIVFIDGADMISTIKPLYTILFEANPKSIGGMMPADDFYYQR